MIDVPRGFNVFAGLLDTDVTAVAENRGAVFTHGQRLPSYSQLMTKTVPPNTAGSDFLCFQDVALVSFINRYIDI